MRSRRIYLLAACCLVACGAFSGEDTSAPDPFGPDGGAEASSSDGEIDGPASGFVMQLDPPHVTADPGDNVLVTIRLTRAASFTDVVEFAIGGGKPGVSFTMPVATDATSSSFSVVFASVDGGAPPALGDDELSVTAFSRGSTYKSLVKLGLRIGSVLPTHPVTGAFDVPPFAEHLDVKAWGAGGGGMSAGTGGFAIARVAVLPSEKLFAIAGTAGDGSYGGGGGGFSGLRRGTSTWLLIAGGGGGGGATSVADSTFTRGGGGGGGDGGDGSNCPFDCGRGGSQLKGGAGGGSAQAGASLLGGNAEYTDVDGGFPGGGRGGSSFSNTGAGGGGGGFYGGGGGGANGGSGGGGSGWISDAGSDGSLSLGDFNFPPRTTDSDYQGSAGQPGVKGLVVIRLVKPH